MNRAAVSTIAVSLLDTFPPQIANNLHSEDITLRSRATLIKAEQLPEWVYFPHRGSVVSLTRTAESGATVEVGIIGSEGIVGIQSILSNQPAGSDGVVQISGRSSRVALKDVRRLLDANADIRNLLLGTSMGLLSQVSQHVVCNRIHTIEQRLAKWLLGVHDRVDTDELSLTHEFLSNMLGIRRSGVTVAVGALEQNGIIKHHRSSITIIDREGLEECSCECYKVMRDATTWR